MSPYIPVALGVIAVLAAGIYPQQRLQHRKKQLDYLLRPGPTTTRNAIALLDVLGAPPEVVAEALERTDRLRAGGSKPS